MHLLFGAQVQAHWLYNRIEILLLAKAFIAVSQNAKQSTDKKTEKFWEKISQQTKELIPTSSKLNEKNLKYEAIKAKRGIEFLHNCWQQHLQPASQILAKITYQNPKNSGEVKDDMKIDLSYSQISEEYSSPAHTYTKSMPKTFSKLIKTYNFFSKHPMFEVRFRRDCSKLSRKYLNSMRKAIFL